MSGMFRDSDSSDEDDGFNVITGPDSLNHSSSDSDSEFLEVAETADTPQTTTPDIIGSYHEEPVFHPSYYSHYSDVKNEQDQPSHSSDDRSDRIDDFHDFESTNYESSANKKKKKKDKSSDRNNEPVPSNKKASKRKRNYEDLNSNNFGNSKKKHFENNTSFRNKKSTLSEDSLSSDEDIKQKPVQYIPNSSALPNLSDDEDEPKYQPKSKTKQKTQSRSSSNRYNPYSETTALKTRIDSSNKGNLLLQKMGYREGEGLGKHAQGRIEPVELSKQKGRRGLGHSIPGLDNEIIEWDPSLEEINIRESVFWLKNEESNSLDFDIMFESWLCEGPKNLDIESMTDFVDEELLSNILKKKSVFDNLTEDELQKTVLRSNPFEALRKGIFMNRAALKMANMDSAFDFMFTEPKYRDDTPMVGENELLYFADVCAGPGGFSEYVLWRKKWHAKGIGFTLKGDCDFKIQDFLAGPSETFEPYYGVKDDGNIYDPANIDSLTKFVMKVTDGKGVHFMMADGGFSVKGQENVQELLSKQLYLCQFLVALNIVRESGHFVCKLFDIFSPFSAGLVYLIYRAFHKISIFKPNTSRPANSERYIICKHKRGDFEAIRDYLYQINLKLFEFGPNSDLDIVEIVPVAIIKDNSEFFCYLRDSNNRLGNKQIVNLDKIFAFYQDHTLQETLQSDLRKQCLDLWKVPPSFRRLEKASDAEVTKKIMLDVFKDKFKPEKISETLNLKGEKLKPDNLKKVFSKSVLDWKCVPLGSDKLTFILGLGKTRVYQWGGSRWNHELTATSSSYDNKLTIELPAGTLLYGEFVPEYKGEGAKQKKITAFHIIDGISVGYEIISHYHYEQRLNILNLFTNAVRKYTNNIFCPIRVKSPTELKNIHQIFRRMENRYMKTGSYEMCLEYPEDDYLLQMKGISFIRITREPWHKHLSSKNLYYYFNEASGESYHECDLQSRCPHAIATTVDSLHYQVIWIWEAGVGFKGEDKSDDVLHKDDLIDFIARK